MTSSTPENDSGAQLRDQYAASGGVHRTFSTKVNDYLLSRPDYPAALFELLRVHGGLLSTSTVADVGAGTGLLTQGLLGCGWHAIAVEPNDEMRAAAQSLLGHWPQFRCIGGSAEATGLADHSVDLITVAQAFHWFDSAASAREFRRILRPGAPVALIWNDRVAHDPLNAALDRVFDEFGGSRRASLLAHEQVRAVEPFFGGAPRLRLSLPHQHQLSGDKLLSLVFSRSYMPDRDSAEGAAVIGSIRRLVDSIGRHGIVSMRYRSELILGSFC